MTLLTKSYAESLASLPEAERLAILRSLKPQQAEQLLHDWRFWARPSQLAPPGDWLVWLNLAGRGAGKTRVGAEWVRARVKTPLGGRGALIARNPADARDTMIEGESGILNIGHPSERPEYESSKRRLTWANGAQATIYTSYEPDQLRGPQHHWAWADEICSFKYVRETFENLTLGMRLGERPQIVITTTPKPLKILQEIIDSPYTALTRGNTYDNRANLPRVFYDQIVNRYAGTTLGRQEIYGELLTELPGALWKRSLFVRKPAPELVRVVVAIDPAVTSGEDSDETGILIAGKGTDGNCYVLADRSGRFTPDGWAKRAIQAFAELNCDRIIAEANNGGEMVSLTLRTVDSTVPIKLVHASRGKQARAEPVVALYEQGKIFHTAVFSDLEDQLCTWLPEDGASPDRMDALVWAITELMLSNRSNVRWLP